FSRDWSSDVCSSDLAAGNIYSTGNYINSAPDFDPGPGTFLLESAGTIDKMFISKLDAGGNFVWAKQASGTHFNVGNDIAVSPSKDRKSTRLNSSHVK